MNISLVGGPEGAAEVIDRHGLIRPVLAIQVSPGVAGFPAPLKLASDGVGSWWQLPRAVEVAGVLYSGGVTAAGEVFVAATDAVRRLTTRRSLITFPPDDHNNPALLIQPGRPPVVAVTEHNGPTYVWRGETPDDPLVPGDLSSLGAPTELVWPQDASYMQLYRLPDTDTLVLLTRTGATNQEWHWMKSQDYGQTWGPSQKIVGFSAQGYLATTQVGGVLRALAYQHPTLSGDHRVWRFDIDLATGAIADDSGIGIGVVGSDPIDKTEATLVYDPPAEVSSTRICDISASADCEIGVITFDEQMRGTYQYGRRSDGYALRPLVGTGRDIGYPTYHGGLSFPSPAAGGVCYLARESAGLWWVEKWTTPDAGLTWARQPIYGAQKVQARPYAPLDRDVGPEVIWYELDRYGTFTDYAGRSLAPGQPT